MAGTQSKLPVYLLKGLGWGLFLGNAGFLGSLLLKIILHFKMGWI